MRENGRVRQPGLQSGTARGYREKFLRAGTNLETRLPRLAMKMTRTAKFKIGEVVRHRIHPFRGIIFDVDPVFANTEEWWLAIPAANRPRKDQPYYHLFAENAETVYVAYVSEQNLLPDTSGEPLRHPQVGEQFIRDADGQYRLRNSSLN
jgi:heat shock protein HspQ